MSTVSAGILVYRLREGGKQALLGHPGGPLWASRGVGWWSVPKGLVAPGEAPLDAARREFREETGLAVEGPFWGLQPVRQKSGKLVHCWTTEADLDLRDFKPGHFEMEWPRRSGERASFPEIDRLEYFDGTEALRRILPAQRPLLVEALGLAL